MKTVSAFAGSLCLLMATSIQAGSVDKEAVTAFSGGTTISSAEMNTNFNTVIGAVDGNASDIATLQTSVDELKSRLDLLDAFITLEEMVGKTYCLVSDFTALTSTDSHSWLRVNNGTSSGILTISSSSEVSLAAADVNEAELGWSLGDGVNSQIQDQSTSDPAETLPIVSFTNGVLTLGSASESLQLFASKRGDMLIGQDYSYGASTDDNNDPVTTGESSMIVMVQCR